MSRKRIVVVGNGGINVETKEGSLKRDVSEIVDSADEVVRFQGCLTYDSNMVGKKTTMFVMRDIFDPNTTHILNQDSYIPKEVTQQCQQLYIAISGAHMYGIPEYYQRDWANVSLNCKGRPLIPITHLAFYQQLTNLEGYYTRYPALRNKPVHYIHQHDTNKFLKHNGVGHYTVDKVQYDLIASCGLIFLYYLVYYSQYVFNADIELVGFTWNNPGHSYPTERVIIERWQEEGLITTIHMDDK